MAQLYQSMAKNTIRKCYLFGELLVVTELSNTSIVLKDRQEVRNLFFLFRRFYFAVQHIAQD